MTSVLNRKFDVLARSGTCPPYLLDVLSLLVAHANDTELYKTEMRSAPFTEADVRAKEEAQVAMAEARLTETVLEDTVKASHETILLAAEHSLRAYAEDLKKVNDVAIATSAKQLRELRTSTRQEMDEFHDRLCEAAAKQSARDLEVLRAEWLESVRAEAERLKNSVDLIAREAEAAIQQKAADYAAFVSHAHNALHVQPALDAHVAMGSSWLLAEQVAVLSASAASRTDVDLLAERLKQAERTIARMSSLRYDTQGGGPEPAEALSATPATQTPLRRAQDGGSAAAPPVMTLPVSTAGGAEGSHGGGARWEVPQLGVDVEGDDGGDGVVVAAMRPGSAAAAAGLQEGFIISHVDRTAVFSPQEMREAVDAACGVEGSGAVRLTAYDPEEGCLRIVVVKV